MDNDPDPSNPADPRTLYRAHGKSSLQGRVLFTNALEGDADAAFLKRNDPHAAEIQRLVKKGYLVRTRADEPIVSVVRGDAAVRRDRAFASGAQIVSTDWPGFGMAARYGSDYVVKLDGGGGGVVRCNPVTAPRGCEEVRLEEEMDGLL